MRRATNREKLQLGSAFAVRAERTPTPLFFALARRPGHIENCAKSLCLFVASTSIQIGEVDTSFTNQRLTS